MTSSKKAATTGGDLIVDEDVSSAYNTATEETLKLIANASYGGAYIDLREQAERLQTRPDLTAKAIALAEPVEEKRNQRRSEGELKKEPPNFEGLAIPALPIPVKALLRDPECGVNYLAMKDAAGEDSVIYSIKKREGVPTVQAFTWRVMAGEINGEAAPVVVTPDDKVLEDGEFIGHQIGNGGHCYVKFGPVVVKVPIAAGEDFIDERRDRSIDPAEFDYPVGVGVPPMVMKSARTPGLSIPTMKSAPMEFIHPRFEDKVPWKKPLKIEKILGLRTRYDGVRVVVTDEAGNVYAGVLAVDGIRQICGERQKSERGGMVNVLTDKSIGRRFQIDGAACRKNKAGHPINVEGQTEGEFRRANPGENFVECWDVFVSNPDDQFEIDL